MKILTVTVPMYNVEAYLDQCLASFIVPDAEEDLEVLIINDGSPDHSRDIAQEYVNNYPAIFRIVDKENGGHGSTVNRGIEEASGKYFKVVDGDDWVEQAAFIHFLAHLKKTNADMVLSNYQWVDHATMEKKKEVEEICPGIQYGKDIPFEQVKDRIFTKMHALTYKTEVLRNQPERLDEKCFYVDTEYIVFPLPYVKSVSAISDCVYQYRIGMSGQSMNIENMLKRCDQHEKVLRRLLAFYKAHKECEAVNLLCETVARMAVSHYKIYFYFPTSHKEEFVKMDRFIKKEFPEVYRKMKNPAVQFLRFTGYVGYSVVAASVRILKK